MIDVVFVFFFIIEFLEIIVCCLKFVGFIMFWNIFIRFINVDLFVLELEGG